MLIKIPQDASPEMSEFCRSVNDMFDVLLGGRNVDFKGRRIINAGDAEADQDYITRVQAVKMIIAGGGRVNPDGSAVGSAAVSAASAPAPATTLAADLARVSLRA